MYRVCLFGFLVFLATPARAEIVDSPVFINEFHYDNVGADENEFVEVVAPESWTDLAGVTLTLYNGGNGVSYAGPAGLDKFTRRGAADGFVFYTLDIAMQNGTPDGMALAWGSQVVQFISFEGSFAASNGVALGMYSTDIRVFEEVDTPLGYSLQLAGSGDSYGDFTWQPAAPHTSGTVNRGQSFVVPEPATALMWCALLGLLALGGQRRRSPRAA